ncbi:MAG: polysaccharide deacetylase family protein [Myxococcota bacterium]
MARSSRIRLVVLSDSGRSAKTLEVRRCWVYSLGALPLSLLALGFMLGKSARPLPVSLEARVEQAPLAAPRSPAPEQPQPPSPGRHAPPPVIPATPELDRSPQRCSGRLVPDRGNFHGKVALTFDDGPHAEATPKILDLLRQHEVPATFFVNGNAIDDSTRWIVEEIEADPSFSVASHGYAHEDLSRLPFDEAAYLIDRNHEVLSKLGVSPRYFRFPFGHANCAMTRAVRARGYRVVGWHVSSADWCFAERGGTCMPRRHRWVQTRYRRDMSGHVMKQVRRGNGGIILFHDRLMFTAEQLGGILERLRDEGYVFTRLGDVGTFPRLNGHRIKRSDSTI